MDICYSKIINMAPYRVKQNLQGIKPIVQDLLKDEIIVPSVSSLNLASVQTMWPMFKLENNQ
jgi:hypothetical protein